MRPKPATVLVGVLLTGALVAGGQGSGGRPDVGVSLYPGLTPAPEIEKRLEGLRNVRWIAMGVSRTGASLGSVIEHFRGEQVRLSGSPETSRRLKEWLDKSLPASHRTPRGLGYPSVLVRDAEGRSRLVNVETGRSQPVEWPGDAGGAIALSEGGLVLYWGLPTEGAPPEFTRISGSALGPRPMKTLKVAILGTGNFETLLPTVDPRRDVAFGRFTGIR